MAFFFLRTDAFSNTLQNQDPSDQAKKDLDEAAQNKPIRRPYRGIQIKEDTYSTLSVLKPNGKPIPLISSSDTSPTGSTSRIGQVREYSDYILQGITQQRVEKQQIIETFGSPYVYFFGERPRVVEVQGLLLNTEDFNWRSQFWKNYEENLRGTKLVQQNARVYLSFDTIIIEGYILQAQSSENSPEPYSVPFNFSMLATGYFDWSEIGQTRFPGYDQNLQSLDVLNRELEDRRSRFVSTGEAVRLANLQESGGGVLSALRGGIRTVNTGIVAASNLIRKVSNVVGGRTVRVPIGIAGFLQNAGAATVAQGSLSTNSPSLGKQFDAATGQFKNVTGSVKLRLPGNATFAPTWVSDVTKTGRGYIFENVDEYPTRREVETLKQLMSTSQYTDLTKRRLQRQLAVEKNDKELALHNQLAAAGGIIGDIAEAVDFAKDNFGMVMSAASLARNFPEGAIDGLKASLGIGIGTTSQSRIQGRKESLEPELQKRGLKTAYEDKSALSRVGNFIGGSALRTFEATATANTDPDKPVTLGEAYDQSSYQQVVAEGDENDFSYEPAYGDQNYEALTSSDPSIQKTLEEVYGNVDGPFDLEASSVGEVYGAGSSSSSVRTPAEVAELLRSMQSNSVEADEDRSGIRGIGDVDAPIDPVI
jgi:hypothetical protein